MAYDTDSFVDPDISLKNCFRLVILGARKVGKSCVINWLLNKVFQEPYIPTVENFYKKIFKIRGEMYCLEILDTSGNDPFPAIKKLNIMTGDIFILVFSLTDINSYVQIKTLCDEIKELKKTKNLDKNISNILILGNKLDQVMDARNKKTTLQQRCVDPIDAQNFALTFKSCYYAEISCKTEWGISTAFHEFLEKCQMPIEIMPTKHRRLSYDENLDQQPQITRGYFKAFKSKQAHNDTKSGYNSYNFQRSSNLRRSIKKLTFQRQFGEAYGQILLNTRRPSIRSDMKLLEQKTANNKSNKKVNYSKADGTKQKLSNFFGNLSKLCRRNTVDF